MAQLNSEVRHLLRVRDLTGAVVTGLTLANFTPTLRRRSGSAIVSTTETVGVSEIGGGDYWVFYTPTIAATLYQLKIVPVSAEHAIYPDEWQDDVEAASTATAGPYLTTLANVKAAFGSAFKGTDQDARISALLPQVTALFQRYCNRIFAQGTATEYPPFLSGCARVLLVNRPPIVTVTSLHVSLAIPRVYDATTLLVEGTDFIVSEDGQWVEFVTPRYINGYTTMARASRLVYVGGYAIIPEDLERAAQEVIAVKCSKSAGDLYHFTGVSRDDGSMQGLRWDDITPSALEVMDAYRLRAIS